MKLKHLFENETNNIITNITTPLEAYRYADRQGKRVPELEPIIKKNPGVACDYAKEVIKDRWPDAEPHIKKNPYYWNDYLREFPEARTPSRDIPVLLGSCALMDIPNTITDEQILQIIRLVCEDHTISAEAIKRKRVYNETIIKNKLDHDDAVSKIYIKKLEERSKEKLMNVFFFALQSTDFDD